MALKIKIRLFFWFLLVFAVILLLYSAVAPGGKISYSSIPGERNYFIGKLSPAERMDQGRIIGDPVYFSLRTPRKFDHVRITLEYEKSGDFNLPIIETGLLADNRGHYSLKPVENKILDDLAWDKIAENNLVLYQRNKKFSSIGGFLDDLPVQDGIALYNHNLDKEYLIDSYEPSQKKSMLGYPLRGEYQFFTYIKNEDLDFKFTVSDLNRNKVSDEIDLNVYYENKPIYSRRLEDDGIADDSGRVKEDRDVGINLSNLPEGVYKVEFKAGDDMITRRIETANSRISFINKIWLADNGKNDLNLYTDSKSITAQTTNPGRLQKIKIGDQEIRLKNTFEQVGVMTDYSLKDIRLEKDDIILSGDGVFAFAKGHFVNPSFRKINSNTEMYKDGIDYVLAEYKTPEAGKKSNIATLDFDLKGAYRENGKYGFLISVPGLRVEDGPDDGLIIKKIEVDLEGKDIFEFLKKKLNLDE